MTFKKGQSGNPAGKKKGTLDRYTHLKNAILDAVNIAAKDYKDEKGKGMTTDKYLGMICKAEPLQFLKVAAGLLPKDVNISGELTLVDLIMELKKKRDAST